MFFCPYYEQFTSYYRENMQTSYVRILHASPDAPAVDVYINNKIAAGRLPYRGFTPYLTLPRGKNNIKLYAAGTTTNPMINTDLDIPGNSILTVAAINELKNISLLPIDEPKISGTPGKVYVKFVHLSPNAPNVNVVAQNENILFKNIDYKQITDYKPLDPGLYTFDLRLTSNNERILHVPNIRLLPNRFYSLYAVGLAGKTPPLQLLIPLDGNTYLR